MEKIEVHRSSVYVWKERALAALEEVLQPHKRGPKFKRLQKTPEDEDKESKRRDLTVS